MHIYEESLTEAGLSSLTEVRKLADSVQTWRIMTGKDRVDLQFWWSLVADERQSVGAVQTRLGAGLYNIQPVETAGVRQYRLKCYSM